MQALLHQLGRPIHPARQGKVTYQSEQSLSVPCVTCTLLQIPASHKVEPKGIEYIKFTGSAQDEKALHEWIGTQSLPLKFSDGPFDMKAVGIRTATGTVELT